MILLLEVAPGELLDGDDDNDNDHDHDDHDDGAVITRRAVTEARSRAAHPAGGAPTPRHLVAVAPVPAPQL